MALEPNQILGPYVLIRPLGRGTFGEVWLARHHDLGEERALKVPTDPQYVSQLRREGKVIYGLQHDNIVRGFDINTLNDPPYVAMEYVAGVSLRQKLKATGKLAVPEAVTILRQILVALAHAHEHGVLHRDLKPENILLTTGGVVKVTDFGLGKVQAALAQSILFSGSMVSADGRNLSGTIQYMSPQQQAGEEPDLRDDLYAVGIIACEVLTGARPAPVGIARMLERAGVDAKLSPWLEKALEQERGERYATAIQMASAVQDALAVRPTVQATPPLARSRTAETPQPVRKVPATVSAPRAPDSTTRTFTNSIGMQFVRIEPGEFLMGSPPDEEGGRSDIETQHRVRLSRPFMMAIHPVTQAQWRAVMGIPKPTWWQRLTGSPSNTPSYFNGDDLPVERVSWDDVVVFCQKLSQQEDRLYRLPTEAEWEYACRAGTTTPFHFGPRISTDQANYNGDHTYGTGVKGVYRRKTIAVGSLKSPNPWGLHDMHGNVWEWCQDWYGDYLTGDVTDPTGPVTGSSRVLRGGSWGISPLYCRAASRNWRAPAYRDGDVGFRLALDFH